MVYPLADIRVLDLSRVVSGPFATRMMCDLGADVVKLEPPAGDMSRVWGESRHGLSGFYTQHNVGKRNLCLDLRAPGAPALVLRLAAVADVVVENFRPGVAQRLGIGWEALNATNPQLVMLSISGFGQDGPRAGRAAFAPVIHAESGLIARQAWCDDAQFSDPVLSIADYNTALHGLVAVLAALRLRDRTGLGQHIDLAMIDAMLATDDYAHHALDSSPVVRLGGEVWEVAGGPMLISGQFKSVWFQLRQSFGLVDPSPPGAVLAEKFANRRRVVADWLASFGERDAVVAVVEAAGLAWGDVHTSTEALAATEAEGRSMVASVDDRGGGRRRVVQSPYRFSAAEAEVQGPAPYRGEHNAEVLADWLGLDAGSVQALDTAGVLAAEQRPALEA